MVGTQFPFIRDLEFTLQFILEQNSGPASRKQAKSKKSKKSGNQDWHHVRFNAETEVSENLSEKK